MEISISIKRMYAVFLITLFIEKIIAKKIQNELYSSSHKTGKEKMRRTHFPGRRSGNMSL